MNEQDLKDLEEAGAREIARIRERYAEQLKSFALEKLEEIERKIAASNEESRQRYEEALVQAEGYRKTSEHLANTSIEFARNQYAGALKINGQILDGFRRWIEKNVMQR